LTVIRLPCCQFAGACSRRPIARILVVDELGLGRLLAASSVERAILAPTSAGTFGGEGPKSVTIKRGGIERADDLAAELKALAAAAIIHDRVLFGPVLEYAYLVSIGPRIEVDNLNVLPQNPYTAPYEELRLRAR
jgi:hypothetical protein